MRRVLNEFFVAALILASAHNAYADISLVGPGRNPRTAPGLLLTVYHLGDDTSQSPTSDYNSVINQLGLASWHSPHTASIDTDVNTARPARINLLGDYNTRTDAFLGAHSDAVDAAPLASTLINWQGWIHFPVDGTYTVKLASIDAAAVFIGGNGTPGTGTLLLEKTQMEEPQVASGLPDPVEVNVLPVQGVTSAGWYPIEIFYYSQISQNAVTKLKVRIDGPADVQFAAPYGFVPGAYHAYTFDGDASDSTNVPADAVNATLAGDAQVSGGALVTPGDASAAGAQLSAAALAPFFGSFTLEQGFTAAAQNSNGTLFSISSDANHLLLAQLGSDSNSNAVVNVTIKPGDGSTYTAQAAAPTPGTRAFLALTYDATTQRVKLFINGHRETSTVLKADLSLASLASDAFTGINGFSPNGDPGFNGSTDTFLLYRGALSQPQVTQEWLSHRTQ